MTVVRFVRRWGLLALGVAVFLVGLTMFVTQTTIVYEWTAYDPLSARALLPGAPTSDSATAVAPEAANLRRASFRGQISIVAGLILVAGWVAFRLRRRAKQNQDAVNGLVAQRQAAAGQSLVPELDRGLTQI